MSKESENIHVVIRIRPFSEKENDKKQKSVLQVVGEPPQSIFIENKGEQKYFHFDSVLEQKSSQTEVFNLINDPLKYAFQNGYNATIFAYGQTGAGKTYTMQGEEKKDLMGIQPRAIQTLFQSVTQLEKQGYTCSISMSCFEIYNESVIDMMKKDSSNLNLREDVQKGVFVEGLYEKQVFDANEAIKFLKEGNKNRHIAATEMNRESSRSHCVFTINFKYSKEIHQGSIITRFSRLHFVDLAGSERQTLTKSIGQRLKEAGSINKSLTVLGQVINSLAENRNHIPYRDSKLTFYLKDSLGGNSKTFLIGAISPSESCLGESISTLRFAQRAKQIKNKISINEETDYLNPEAMRQEIRRLRKEICIIKDEKKLERVWVENLFDEQVTQSSQNTFSDFIKSFNLKIKSDQVTDIDSLSIIILEKFLEQQKDTTNILKKQTQNSYQLEQFSQEFNKRFEMLGTKNKINLDDIEQYSKSDILSQCTQIFYDKVQDNKDSIFKIHQENEKMNLFLQDFKFLIKEKKDLITQEYDMILEDVQDVIENLETTKTKAITTQCYYESIKIKETSLKNSKNQIMKKDSINFENNLKDIEKQKEQLLSEIKAIEKQKSEISQWIIKDKEILDINKKNLTDIQFQYNQYSDKMKELNIDNELLQAEQERMKKQIKNKKQKQNEIKKEIKNLQSQIHNDQNILQDQQTKFQENQVNINSQIFQNEQLQNQLEKIQVQIKEQIYERDELIRINGETKKKISDLQGQIQFQEELIYQKINFIESLKNKEQQYNEQIDQTKKSKNQIYCQNSRNKKQKNKNYKLKSYKMIQQNQHHIKTMIKKQSIYQDQKKKTIKQKARCINIKRIKLKN